ncbi:MAG: hypothetical protein AAGB11_09090 [Pseudomonadota bacterium]
MYNDKQSSENIEINNNAAVNTQNFCPMFTAHHSEHLIAGEHSLGIDWEEIRHIMAMNIALSGDTES